MFSFYQKHFKELLIQLSDHFCRMHFVVLLSCTALHREVFLVFRLVDINGLDKIKDTPRNHSVHRLYVALV